jgi:uncharacterized OB-fold protein
MSSESIRVAADRLAAAAESSPRVALDPVNLPMIRHWCEALGDSSYQRYADAGLAPPAMIQVWTMPGLPGTRALLAGAGDDPLAVMTTALDEAGYTSVVATDCAQEYHRYLRVGERVTIRSRLEDVSGPKRTSLGEGWFVTTRSTWYCGDEPVGTMMFRVLKFRPPAPAPAAVTPGAALSMTHRPSSSRVDESSTVVNAGPLRPVISPDTQFFWDGTAAGELRIQRCGGCGALRHPPGPMCPECGAAKHDYLVAAGTGQVYSYVVHHHPPVPGRTAPFVVALVELTEGVRMMGELLGVPPEDVSIGMPVASTLINMDDEITRPAWRLARAGDLPELRIDTTTKFVISSALATRDFQDVHHDRDAAVRRGSRDIFVNILTTTGLVQRYVTDWAGPDATVREIAIRLGAPCYAGDTLTFSGQADNEVVKVTGRCSQGNHVTGTVKVTT